MDEKKKTRIEFLLDVFTKDYASGVKSNLFLTNDNSNENSNFYDPTFLSFCKNSGLKFEGSNYLERTFNFLIQCDPTKNKEYVNWFLILYRKNIRHRLRIKLETEPIDSKSNDTFFEDLYYKAKISLNTFTLLKKTNLLPIKQRDINLFKDINEFISFIIPYRHKDFDDFSELQCLQNFEENITDDYRNGRAELVFENEEWSIVIPHDQYSSYTFGKDTSWCTASSRESNSFASYNSRGKLFILLKKGIKKIETRLNPMNKLQFHFEDEMFMDIQDRPIDITEFLNKNSEIREYFKTYIVENILSKQVFRKKNDGEKVKYLLKFGLGDELIDILKKMKVTSVDFSYHLIDQKYLNRIGEITTIEILNLTNCGLRILPNSICGLPNLKTLIIKNNPKLEDTNNVISNLTSLVSLDAAGCDIKHINDISKNCNLESIALDRNVNLTKLPNISGLSKLIRLTAASCNLQRIEDDILSCTSLYLFDVNNNINLNYIPVGIVQLPQIISIILDETNIDQQTINQMHALKNKNVFIIKYGQ
jgi:hypothetical protein